MGGIVQEIFNKVIELIKTNDNIYIMTHCNADFDGMGSSIALQQIINKFGKKSYIIRNYQDSDKSLKKVYNYLEQKNINCSFISKTEALKCVDNNLLFILDTQKSQLLEIPELLNKTTKVVLIDHHIKSKNSIECMVNYINANLSSTVEFIVEYMKYLNISFNPLIYTFLLAGLEIDTNNFRLKATEKTYEAAAFLLKNGADNVLKQELLQEEKENYIKRQQIIKNSYMVNENMSICVADDNLCTNQDLASIAEKILQFENVEASFVIGKISNDLIGISARSIGTVNVQNIMSKLGGGGHLNEAATQIKKMSLKEVEEQLIKLIGGKL